MKQRFSDIEHWAMQDNDSWLRGDKWDEPKIVTVYFVVSFEAKAEVLGNQVEAREIRDLKRQT